MATNNTPLVVLGESLAAGLVNFSLYADDQRNAFPQLVARQLGVPLAAPLFQPPGVGAATGFPGQPVLTPHAGQTTVLVDPTAGPFGNLAIPGLTLAETLDRRPAPPLVHRDDARQTAINLVLCAPGVAPSGAGPMQTAFEYAQGRQPDLAIVELGFAEAMNAAAAGRPDLLPQDDDFRQQYDRLVSTLRNAGADVVVATIPDPMDTPHCSTLESAARVLLMPAEELRRDYGFEPDDRILIDALTEIGFQIMGKHAAALPAGSTIAGRTAAAISARVQALNAVIAAIARERQAAVADFAGVYRRVRAEGLRAGSRTLTADFLGGFFSLNGYTPGATGQAALANVVIEAINAGGRRRLAPIDLAGVAASDPVADYRPADGASHRTTGGRMAALGATLRLVQFLAGFIAKAVVGGITRKKFVPPASQGNDPSRWTLKLPPKMVQVLPIDSRSSYYGDALTPIHTTDRAEQELGLSGKFLFGGYALFDSRLHGKVRIKFFPPANNIAHFEVTHPGALKGDNTRLVAPLFFKLAGIENQVMDSTSLVSSGDLNLVTGEVTNLRYWVFLLNSAILSLAAVNPSLPKDPIAFPGQWGATWARFDQRADGLLDYTVYITTFIPLSVLKAPIRFPLPFTGPSGSVASVPSDGTALHPHFCLSTRPPDGGSAARAVTVPTNTVREVATADGRWRIQSGSDFGGAVSIVAQPLPPAAIPARADDPPGQRVNPVNDDRLNLPVGAVDLATGAFLPAHGSRLPRLRWDGSSISV